MPCNARQCNTMQYFYFASIRMLRQVQRLCSCFRASFRRRGLVGSSVGRPCVVSRSTPVRVSCAARLRGSVRKPSSLGFFSSSAAWQNTGRSYGERGLLGARSWSTSMGQVLSKPEGGTRRPNDMELYFEETSANPVAIRSAQHRAEYSAVEHGDVIQSYALPVNLRRCWMPVFTLPTAKAVWYFSCAALAPP